MSEHVLSGNVGEWSEVYAFFHLLGFPYLVACDADLNPFKTNHLPVISIYRGEGPNGPLAYYYIADKGGIWAVSENGELGPTISAVEGANEAKALLLDIQKRISEGKKAEMQFPKAQQFLARLCDCRLKAKASDKEDIILTLNDIRAGQNISCGFSIKSYLGSDPTLLNASVDNTNILYHVHGIDDQTASEIMQQAQANPNKKIKILMELLQKAGAKIEYQHLMGSQFAQNLNYIDTIMPDILGELLLMHYLTWEESLEKVTQKVAEEDPVGLKDPNLYYYKIKKFLEAVALGMTPSKPWKGAEDANGGFLIVKPDGNLVTYHLYNRQALDEYLLRYTRFEHPSTTRHQYASLFPDENGQLCLKLALQVRFCKAG